MFFLFVYLAEIKFLDMAILYSYKKYKDVHTITSIETTLSISYTVTKVTCDMSTIVLSGTILPGGIVTIPFYKQPPINQSQVL